MDYKELILQYADSLKTDLTWASKTHINMLTMLAAENKAAAASICAAIERHILSAPAASKLPTLYLVDSIVKNVQEPYISLFCRNLAQVFFAVWKLREVQPQMRKLLSMWEGIFPQQLLSILKRKTEQPELMQSSGLRRSDPPVQYQSNQWSRSQGSVHQPVSTSGRNGYPTESHTYHQRGRPMSASYQHPQYAYQHSASLQPPGMGVQNTSAPTRTWHQQQGAPAQFAVTQQPSSQPLVLPQLLSSLLSSGLLTVPDSVSIAPPVPQAAGPAVYYTHPPSRAATPEAVTAEACNFVPSRLKEFNPAALARLMDSSAQLRSKHLDMQFMRRRRQKNPLGVSRQWFVNAELWLAGTAAADAGEGQLDNQPQESEEEKEIASVPVDDEQPRCALSGEKFEKFWHDDHQEWHYKHAVRISAEDAAKHGLHEGALVLESTLAATPSSSQEAPTGNLQSQEGEAAESGEAGSEMQGSAHDQAGVPHLQPDLARMHKRPAGSDNELHEGNHQLHLDKKIKLEA
ncbi:hypothetical protein ABBQ38_000433 [Trebouxia sp. C0009 RCD-2024]